MVRSGTIVMWRQLAHGSVPVVTRLASDVESGWFLVIKNASWRRKSDVHAVLWRHLARNRKTVLRYSEFEGNPLGDAHWPVIKSARGTGR